MPTEHAIGEAVPEDLWRLRRSIDNIDAALVHMLAERFRVTREVGVLKAVRRMQAVDVSREEAQVAKLRGLADRAGLDADFAEEFIRRVMAEVVRQHEVIAREQRGGTTP
jgi:chorismate mutase